MEIEKFRDAKKALEVLLATVIQTTVSQFEGETGYTPSGISVSMVDVRAVQDRSVRYVVGAVQTYFDLFK